MNIESNNPEGLILNGETVHVHAGGVIAADRVTISMTDLTVDQAGVIVSNETVSYTGFMRGVDIVELPTMTRLVFFQNRFPDDVMVEYSHQM